VTNGAPLTLLKIRSSPPLPGTRSTSGTSKMPASVSKQRAPARSIPWSRRNRANWRKRCDQRYAFCYSCHIIRDFRTTLGRWSICIICMLTLFVVLPSHVIAGVPTIPNRVFALIKSGAPTGSSALSNPDVDGISLREGWDAVNPSEDVYDWSYFDAEITKAQTLGKGTDSCLGRWKKPPRLGASSISSSRKT
jgi:hypothetical protein